MTFFGNTTAALLAVLTLAGPANALTLSCSGAAPDWTLTVDNVQARLAFPTPTDMDVMLTTPAEGRDWPQALTLIGERDTAIVLIEREQCQDKDFRAHVMTQRGSTAILLSGCCVGAE